MVKIKSLEFIKKLLEQRCDKKQWQVKQTRTESKYLEWIDYYLIKVGYYDDTEE